MSCILVNCVPARVTLGIMAFLMFLVTQMVKVNLNIVVVAINNSSRTETNTTSNYTDVTSSVNHKWNENVSGLLLGAIYWSYWATELPGGLLAQRFGGRRILGVGVAVSGLVNLLLPWACGYHFMVAALLRAVQGLALGVTWPAMHWLSARWIPPIERSKFMTSYHGAAIGTAVTYPLSGLIIAFVGWEYVFYLIGAITLLWSFAWWILVFDSPAVHPRMSQKERLYLLENVTHVTAVQKEKVPTPWRQILSSRPFWAVLLASQGLMWGTITLSMQIVPYLYQMHRLDIKMTGLLSGIPEVCKFIFGLLFSFLIDKSIKRGWLSLTSARKVAVSVSEFLPALLMIAVGFLGANDVTTAVALLAASSAAGGASSSGSLANIVDLSPNHAGTLLGLIKSLTIVPGVISPLVATYFTSDTTSNPADNWRNVFLVMSLVYTVCGAAFVVMGSGKVQRWNELETKPGTEMASLTRARKSKNNNSPVTK